MTGTEQPVVSPDDTTVTIAEDTVKGKMLLSAITVTVFDNILIVLSQWEDMGHDYIDNQITMTKEQALGIADVIKKRAEAMEDVEGSDH